MERRQRKDTQLFSRKTLFFPTSPVNILSVSRLADHFDDDEGTSIQTRRHYSILRWKNDSHQVRIEHSNHKLPELAVNTGFSSFTTFCRALCSKINDIILHCHCSLSKKLPTLGVTKKTDFNDNVDRVENQNISPTNVTFPAGTRICLTQEQGRQLRKRTHLPTQAHVCWKNRKDIPQDWGRYN